MHGLLGVTLQQTGINSREEEGGVGEWVAIEYSQLLHATKTRFSFGSVGHLWVMSDCTSVLIEGLGGQQGVSDHLALKSKLNQCTSTLSFRSLTMKETCSHFYFLN